MCLGGELLHSTVTVVYVLALLTLQPPCALAIVCFRCDSEIGSCDHGECSGVACLMIEQTKDGKS